MTYRDIRLYAQLAAFRFANAIGAGDGVGAARIEDAVIEKCGEPLGGLTTYIAAGRRARDPRIDDGPSVAKRQQYLAKVFTLECCKRGVSTRVVHLTKHGEVT